MSSPEKEETANSSPQASLSPPKSSSLETGNKEKVLVEKNVNEQEEENTMTPTNTIKRAASKQLSVRDMFSASPSSTKKARLSINEESPLKQPSSSPLSTSSAKSSPVPKTPFTLAKAKTMPRSTLPPFNSIPFSVPLFKSSLSERESALLDLELQTMGKSWLKILSSEIRKEYFLKLKTFLEKEGLNGRGKIFPPQNDIYSWSRFTPLSKVKVVIIGQDPYHNDGQAHGLCFSVRPEVAIPPSLRNIYAQLKNEYPDFTPPKHGYLASWAQNGVLLLNTSLTVRPHQAGSHANQGWETFTDAVVDAVDLYGGSNLSGNTTGRSNGVVFLAWGSWAAKRVAKLDKSKHLILNSPHPSPLSAHRGFIGNGHFEKANDWLEKRYGPESVVNWKNLELPVPGDKV